MGANTGRYLTITTRELHVRNDGSERYEEVINAHAFDLGDVEKYTATGQTNFLEVIFKDGRHKLFFTVESVHCDDVTSD